MPKQTPFVKAAGKAGDHLMRGFDMAWEHHGKVPLGEKAPIRSNLSSRTNPPMHKIPGYKELNEEFMRHKKNLEAGKPVEPSAHEGANSSEPSGAGTASAYESYDYPQGGS